MFLIIPWRLCNALAKSNVVDSSGAKLAVENRIFVFDFDKSTDSIQHVSEIESAYFDIIVDGIETDEGVVFSADAVQLVGGSDRKADGTAEEMMNDAIALATGRYDLVPASNIADYKAALLAVKASNPMMKYTFMKKLRRWDFSFSLPFFAGILWIFIIFAKMLSSFWNIIVFLSCVVVFWALYVKLAKKKRIWDALSHLFENIPRELANIIWWIAFITLILVLYWLYKGSIS